MLHGASDPCDNHTEQVRVRPFEGEHVEARAGDGRSPAVDPQVDVRALVETGQADRHPRRTAEGAREVDVSRVSPLVIIAADGFCAVVRR